jgi:putative hemolysin
MLTQLLLLLGLILLNGLFAMSEIAIVSSRRARLQQRADRGSTGARHALALAAEPTRFLSSVQVGITSIGILNGAIGEASIAAHLRVWLETLPSVAAYADSLSLAIMVIVLTYVSLILGELVPKRLALSHPEAFASAVAAPMQLVARIGRPLVHLLSVTTDAIVRLAGVRQTKQPGVTAEEVRVMLEQGAEEGVFEPSEHQMVSNILRLDERPVASVLTPRSDVLCLDVRDALDVTRRKLRGATHAVLPLCDGSMAQVLGFVRAARVLEAMVDTSSPDLASLAEPALFVPETMTLMTLLEQFKRTHLPVALVVDEFGGVEGLVSLTDVISSIVGDLPAAPGEEPMIVARADGGWLVDGGISLDMLIETLEAPALATDLDLKRFHTLGGLVMFALDRIPRTGDLFERGGFRFEIADMDGNRVDRVIVSRLREAGTTMDDPIPEP